MCVSIQRLGVGTILDDKFVYIIIVLMSFLSIYIFYFFNLSMKCMHLRFICEKVIPFCLLAHKHNRPVDFTNKSFDLSNSTHSLMMRGRY